MRAGKALSVILLLLLVGALGLMSGSMAAPPIARADPVPDFEMAVDYPSVVVEPGKTVNLNLTLANREKVSHQVDISVSKAPDGWQAVIQDRGYGLKSIWVGPGDTKFVSFVATPPDSVKPDTYSFVIKIQSQDGINQNLPITVTVQQKTTSGTKVVSQYPVLRGQPGSKFEFNVDLTNGTGQEQSYNLAANAPQGWNVYFQPGYESKQISSMRVKDGEVSGLRVEVESPKQVQAGQYPIDLQISTGTEKIAGQLNVAITGSYDVSMGTSSGRLNLDATAGSDAPMSILISNIGSADLNDVSFASDKPNGWQVTFEPKTVTGLAPGATREVNVWIKPDGKAIAGDYLVTVTASNPQIFKQLELRVTVETPTVWGWVGLGIVVLVLGGLLGIFRTLSRR